MSTVCLPLGWAFEAGGSTHRHQQRVLDRRDTRGSQKHVEKSQVQVRNTSNMYQGCPGELVATIG